MPPEIAQEIARRKVKHHKQRAERRDATGHGSDDGGDGERLMFLDDEAEVKVTSRMAADKGRPLRSKHRKRDNTAYIKATHSDRVSEADCGWQHTHKGAVFERVCLCVCFSWLRRSAGWRGSLLVK